MQVWRHGAVVSDSDAPSTPSGLDFDRSARRVVGVNPLRAGGGKPQPVPTGSDDLTDRPQQVSIRREAPSRSGPLQLGDQGVEPGDQPLYLLRHSAIAQR